MKTLTPNASAALQRPTAVLHSLSDVFPFDADPDAHLTHGYRHLRPHDTEHGIGNDITRGAYLVELVAQLVDDLKRQIFPLIERKDSHPHPNLVQAGDLRASGAFRVIANNAPRTRENRQNNGNDFHWALLDNGVEVFATPLEILKYVRHRVLSLYRIPNENHPFFNGQREQFRSSVIARSVEAPEHLQKVYSVDPVVERLSVKLSESPDFSPIPDQEHDLEIGYADHFGNIRLRSRDLAQTHEALTQARHIHLQFPGIEPIRASVVASLNDIAAGEFGLYRNVADGESVRGPGYIEFVRKWGSADDRLSALASAKNPPLGTPVELLYTAVKTR